jgi:sulfur transfer protein SufE
MKQDELLKLIEERDQKIIELGKQLRALKQAAEKDHEPGGIAKLYLQISSADKLLQSLREYGYEC